MPFRRTPKLPNSGGEGVDPHSGSLSLRSKFAEKPVLVPELLKDKERIRDR